MGIVNLFAKISILVLIVCAIPVTPLLTLRIFLSLKILRTDINSVPIPIVLPMEIVFEIVETYMSVTIPELEFVGIYLNTTIVSVETPIL